MTLLAMYNKLKLLYLKFCIFLVLIIYISKIYNSKSWISLFFMCNMNNRHLLVLLYNFLNNVNILKMLNFTELLNYIIKYNNKY